MTEPQPDLLTEATRLLTTAGEKENGQAIAARNDVMRAQVYALLSIAQSLATLVAPQPAEATPDGPETEPDPDATDLPD